MPAQFDPEMFSERRGVGPDVDGDIPNPASDDSHELSLRRIVLVMKPAQDPGSGAGVIVLDEGGGKPRLFELLGVEPLDEKTSPVAEDLGLDDLQPQQWCG